MYIERGEGKLLFHESSIWDELGRKVPPDEIVAFVRECGGEKALKEVISYFTETREAHQNTIRKSIDEAVDLGKLVKETLPGKYGRKVLRLPDALNERGVFKQCQ
jgi:hypothetical protein